MPEMHRELNPELFGEASESSSFEPKSEPAWVKVFETQMARLQNKAKDWEVQISQMDSKLKEFVSSTQNKMERMGKAIQRMDEALRHVHQDGNKKLAQLTSRVNGRKLQDNKVEEL